MKVILEFNLYQLLK